MESPLPAIAVILAALGIACAGGGDPAAPPAPPPAEGGPLDRVHVYDVAPEQLHRGQADDPGTLEVTGTARVEVPADRARIAFAVETEAPSAREAGRDNARMMDVVLRALRETGGGELEVETRGYSLQPRYRRPDPQGVRNPEIVGYRAVNQVEVRTSDLEGVGPLLDAGMDAGANRISSLRFEASRTDEARRRALREAVTGARAEAEAMADALGASLGPPLEVRGSSGAPDSPRAQAFAMEEGFRTSTPVEPGTHTVSAHVTIRYRLAFPPD